MSLSMLGWMQAAGTVFQVLGGLSSASAAKLEGERAKVAAEFQAWQAEEQAGTAIAISQRQALEEQRQGRLAASRALAIAAASGGGASDPTIVNLLANAAGEGAYRAQVALYEGEAKARQLRLDAAAGRLSGAWAKQEGASRAVGLSLAATGAGARGAASLYAKYGMKGPSGSGDSSLVQEPGSDPMRDH